MSSMRAVTKRLVRLEAQFAPMKEATRMATVPSGTALIAQWLDSLGVAREGNESLAETTARAMGWSMGELRAALLRRAAGLPV